MSVALETIAGSLIDLLPLCLVRIACRHMYPLTQPLVPFRNAIVMALKTATSPSPILWYLSFQTSCAHRARKTNPVPQLPLIMGPYKSSKKKLGHFSPVLLPTCLFR